MRLLLMIVLLFATSALAKPAVGVGDVPPPKLGNAASDNAPVDLAALKDRVVVVTFWASWCAPCLKELPVLENLQLTVPPDELRVIAVNIDNFPADYRRILRELKSATMAITHDRTRKIRQRYGVSVIPHLFLVGHDGRVAHVHRGYSPDKLEEFVQEINALLEARRADLVARES